MSQPRPRETFYGLERLGSCLTLYRGREGSLGTEVSMVAGVPQGDTRGRAALWAHPAPYKNHGWEISTKD